MEKKINKYKDAINKLFDNKYFQSNQKKLSLKAKETGKEKDIEKIKDYIQQKENLNIFKNTRKSSDRLNKGFDSFTSEAYLILNKKIRSVEELKSIVFYLSTLDYFMHIVHQEIQKDTFEILFDISQTVSISHILKGKLIQQFNESFNSFYIVAEGEISILNQYHSQEYLTEAEYVDHLIKLFILEEVELMIATIHLNNKLFPINGVYFYNILADYKANNPDIFNLKEIIKAKLLSSNTLRSRFTFDSLKHSEIFITNKVKFKEYVNQIKINKLKFKDQSIDDYLSYIKAKKRVSDDNDSLINHKITHNDSIEVNRIKFELIYYYIYGKYKKSSCIGGYELVGNKCRSSTLFASEDSKLIVISNKSFSKNLYSIFDAKQSEILRNINQSIIFKDFNVSILKDLILKSTHLLNINKNDILIHQNSIIDYCYYLNSGEISVYSNSSLLELIVYLRDYSDNLNLFKKEINEIKENSSLKSYFDKEFTVKLATICNLGVFGLEEFNSKNISFFNFLVTSNYTEIIKINKSNLINVLTSKSKSDSMIAHNFNGRRCKVCNC